MAQRYWLASSLVLLLASSLAGSEKSPKGFLAHLGEATFRHRGEVVALALAPDGKKLATAARDDTLIVWDTATGAGVGRIALPAHPVEKLAFTADGKTVVVLVHGQDRLFLLEVATGQLSAAKMGSASDAFPVALSEDGRLFAKAFNDDSRPLIAATLRLWQVATGEEIGAFRPALEAGWRVETLHFAADGRHLLALSSSAKSDYRINLWEVATGKEKLDLRLALQQPRCRVLVDGLTPDGRMVVVRQDDTLCLYDSATGRAALRLPPDEMPPYLQPVFAADSRWMAVPGMSGKAGLWKLADTSKAATLAGAPGEGVAGPFAFSRDGKRLATSSQKHRITLWDVAEGKRLRQAQADKSFAWMSLLLFAPDGKLLVSGHGDGAVRFWDAETLAQRFQRGASAQPVVFDAFSADGKILATRQAGAVALWDTTAGRPLPEKTKWTRAADKGLVLTRPFTQEIGREQRTFASPDGKSEVIVLCDATPSFGPHSFRVSVRHGQGKEFYDVAWRMLDALHFSADGRLLALLGRQGELDVATTLTLLDLPRDKVIELPKGFGVGAERQPRSVLAVAPDGKAVAFGSAGNVQIWELVAGTPARTLKVRDDGTPAALTCLSFDADSKVLVAGAADGAVAAWAANGRRLLRHANSPYPIRRVVAAPVGGAVLTESEDGTVLLWDSRKLMADRSPK